MSTRRDFLKSMAVTSAGLALTPSEFIQAQNAKTRYKAGKVKIAYVGIGNRGEQIIQEFAKTDMVEVVALCDVDMGNKQTQQVMNMYPKAKRFRDFREMFDKCGNEFDAEAAAVPDFIHFPIAMLAMAEGKHI